LADNWLHAAFTDVSRYVIFAVGVWLTLWVVLAAPWPAARSARTDRQRASC
jgi:hypothetical protein